VRLAIDASRTTVQRITGTERYALELIRGILWLNTRHDITLYFRDPPLPDLFPPSERAVYRVIPFQRLWTHVRFAAAIWQDRPDVTFVPAHTLPVAFPGKAAVTVHDLGFRYFPQAHRRSQRLYLDGTTRSSVRRASIVLVDSQATADDLVKIYGTPASKIRVVYPGVTPPIISDAATVAHKYHLPEHYFLFIGTLQPRKNIARIVQAYALWREGHPGADTGLVLAGGKGWLYDDSWVRGIDGVHLTGYIDDTDKGALYAGARALVFPSLYEGFGFPVLEAMLCGTPVIASTTSSLPELVGDAGLSVDPLDVEAIAGALERIASEDALCAQLRRRGAEQAKKFTWETAAQKALEALESVV
jgi:glycosyltransferase involved in cell wall biosynthesis